MTTITTTNGTKLSVVSSTTPLDHLQAGRPGVAAMLNDFGCVQELICKRPHGHKLFLVRKLVHPRLGTHSFHIICSV